MSAEQASPASWKTEPLPVRRADLVFQREFSWSELERIKQGLIPESMEDKWFIVFDEPWLLFYRSWTGCGIYGLRIVPLPKGAFVAESWVSRDREQYTGDDLAYERRNVEVMLGWLIESEG